MKRSIALILFMLGAASAMAVEYVTLTGSTQSRSVAPTSIVEVVGTNKNNDGNVESMSLTNA